ncbi:MAG: GIY-YIG nuclease family protein [Gammaproteobacteria bacterium]|nr:GIY-YIG nuclease family protein [Gammaproteobacteria bacterium]MCF6362731.1 GIY-YIG nuclease family protein [Gammaproteobacteria bacterium]
MAELSDLELLDALGVDTTPEKKIARSPREERIIAGFEEIQRFVEQQGRLPAHGEENDIFERLYATRLDQIRKQPECRELLQALDQQGLLDDSCQEADVAVDEIDDDELLAQLGVPKPSEGDVTHLRHVKSRAEIRAAEEIANRTPCKEFDQFKAIFEAVQKELDSGIRETRPFRDYAEVREGDLFILSGQKVYIAEVGEDFITEYDRKDSRLRVIYDNGTESDILLRSLQRALNKDSAGRRIIDPSPGPLFSGVMESKDLASGTIYVLRSKSDHPVISENRDVIHKIGVTSGSVEKRIANAKLDPTFLMADVEVAATYELYNINRSKLENIIHKFFETARLDIEINDRFGHPVTPREWFLVPLFVIDEMVEKIKNGTIGEYLYDTKSAALVPVHKRPLFQNPT